MRLTNISVAIYNRGSFIVAIGDPELYIHVDMTEEETDQVRALVTDMFLARQKSIAKMVETARPPMIELQPERIDPAPDFEDDGIPF